MIHELRLFFIALQFLTRIPAPAWVGYDDAWMNQCMRYLPAVGLVVGLAGVAVLFVALAVFPPAVAVGLSMIATVWLTGAFHEDGLADTCDGLGGAVSRERALEIMKDSRIGSYGAVGLMLTLGLKAVTLTALVEIDPIFACLALAWCHAASRLPPVWLTSKLPYAGDAAHAKAKPLATQVDRLAVFVALAWVLLLSLLLITGARSVGETDDLLVASDAEPVAAAVFVSALESSIAAGIGALGVAAMIAARWLRRRLGGFTGDTLGAVQQVSEVVALLAWLAVAYGWRGT